MDKYVNNRWISIVDMLIIWRNIHKFTIFKELIHFGFHMVKKSIFANIAEDSKFNPLIHNY